VINNKTILIVLSILFLVIAIPRIIFPDLDHGDDWADADILIAANNFAKFGFIKTRFLPFFEAEIDAPKGPYLHYPPLGTIINGGLRILFKNDALYLFRGFALFFSLLNLLFWYLFIKRFSGSVFFAFLAGVFYLFNPFFIYGADSLGQISYADSFRSAILFVFIVFIDAVPKRKSPVLLLLWSLFFLESLISYEYILYLFLFFILFKIIFKVKKDSLSFKSILVLFSAPVCGFLLHFLQNIWYLGNISLVLQDFRKIALERIGASQDSAFALTISNWWQQVLTRNFSLVLIFNYFLLFLGLFAAYLFYQRLSVKYRRQINLNLRLLLVLGTCGISWYTVFPSHALAHAYVLFLVRHLLPVAALVFALFFYVAFFFIKETIRYKFLASAFLAGLALFVLFSAVTRSDLAVTPGNIQRAKDFLVFKECLAKLRKVSTDNDVVAINYYRRPFVSHYTGHNAVAIFDKAALEVLPRLPRYFIFLPYNDQRAAQLAGYLKEKYKLIFECQSSRFPSSFWELKPHEESKIQILPNPNPLP